MSVHNQIIDKKDDKSSNQRIYSTEDIGEENQLRLKLINKQDENEEQRRTSKVFQSRIKSRLMSITQKTMRTSYRRWVALLLACSVMMGMQASQDAPSIIQDSIYKDMFNYITERDKDNIPFKTSVNLKYSWIFSIGNITSSIFPFFMGMLVSKYGARKILVILLILVIIGQFTQALTGTISGGWNTSSSYFVFLTGRFFLYLGADSTAVALKTILNIWFMGQEMALALGSPSSFNKLGLTISGWILEGLYDTNNDLLLPFLVLACYIIVALLFSFILIYLDIQRQKEEELLLGPEQIELNEKDHHDFKFSDIKKFNISFWILILCFATMYGNFQSWSNNGNLLLKNQYKVENVGTVLTFPSLMSAIGIPIAGILIDQYGYQQYALLLSSLCVGIGQFFFLVFPQCSDIGDQCNELYYWIPIILFGIYKTISIPCAYSIISIVTNKEQFSSGVGILISSYNLMQFITMQIEALILGGTPSNLRGGYLYQQVFSVILGAISVLLSLLLIYLNHKNKGNIGLNKKQLCLLNAKIKASQRKQSQIVSRNQSKTSKFILVTSKLKSVNEYKEDIEFKDDKTENDNKKHVNVIQKNNLLNFETETTAQKEQQINKGNYVIEEEKEQADDEVTKEEIEQEKEELQEEIEKMLIKSTFH